MARRKKVATRSAKRRPATRIYSTPYVTVAELADYWHVRPKQIYKQIDAGVLRAIRLGPRLVRIRTADACAFEERREWRVMTLASEKDARRTAVGSEERQLHRG